MPCRRLPRRGWCNRFQLGTQLPLIRVRHGWRHIHILRVRDSQTPHPLHFTSLQWLQTSTFVVRLQPPTVTVTSDSQLMRPHCAYFIIIFKFGHCGLHLVILLKGLVFSACPVMWHLSVTHCHQAHSSAQDAHLTECQ